MSISADLCIYQKRFKGPTLYYPPVGQCAVCIKSNGYYDGEPVLKLNFCGQGHTIHQRCLDVWLASSPTCPGCNKNQKLHKKAIQHIKKVDHDMAVTNCGVYSAIMLVIVALFASFLSVH